MKLKTCPECGKEKSAIHFSGDRAKAEHVILLRKA